MLLACPPLQGLPRKISGKQSACNAEDMSSICGLEGFPGEGNGNSLHYACLRNPMDRGTWWATVHGVTKELDTAKRLKQQQQPTSSALLLRASFQTCLCPRLCPFITLRKLTYFHGFSFYLPMDLS